MILSPVFGPKGQSAFGRYTGDRMNFLYRNLIGAVCLLAGCAYVEPLVQDFNMISIPQEQELGGQISRQITREMPVVQDASLNGRVRSIGHQLVNALPRRDFEYRFYVIQNKEPNAFTVPGGAIYVHTGLLKMTDDEELAGVIAHEIGHAFERHPTKALSRALGAAYLTDLLLKNQKTELKQLSFQLAEGGILTRYSRQDEREADELAFFLMKRARMNPEGLIRFLKRLQALERTSRVPIFSTHPSTPERIARLEALKASSQIPQLAPPQQSWY